MYLDGFIRFKRKRNETTTPKGGEGESLVATLARAWASSLVATLARAWASSLVATLARAWGKTCDVIGGSKNLTTPAHALASVDTGRVVRPTLWRA